MLKTKSHIVIVTSISCLLIVTSLNQILTTPLQAVAERESFPDPSSFDQSTGTAINTNLSQIAFISTMKQDESDQENIVAFDETGNGAIITRENGEFRTYTGLKLPQTPLALLSADLSNDQKEDLVGILPPQWISSKDWRRARIIEVGSNYIITDQLLRKNILTQSTIVSNSGNQYIVKSNTGPTDDSPRNAIYLDKQIAPEENPTLADYRELFSVGQYINYLMPIKAISKNITLHVNKSTGSPNLIPMACKPFIPQDIATPTALAIGQFGGDNNLDLSLITHTSEELQSSNVSTAYNTDSHVLTFTIAVPPSMIRSRNLTGSYISFTSGPNKLIPIRQGTENQLIVDVTLPATGEGLEAFQTALLPGDIFWLTTNTDDTKRELVYYGDGQGCFSYTGSLKGAVLETSYGQVTLPNASAVGTTSRSVITDLNANWLPIDSLANRTIRISDNQYTIEHNDQYHLYLEAAAGNVSARVPDALHQRASTAYEIVAIDPLPVSTEERMTKVTSLVMDTPSSIQSMIGGTTLTSNKPQVRAIDIDQDGDKDIIYLNAGRIFLKINNENSL
jgi:hypothetical protein